MLVDADKLSRVFRLVADLEAAMVQYCRDGRQTPVPWENVVDAVEQMARVRITVTRKDVPAGHINASIKRWSDNTAEITVQGGMAQDLDNFSIIKEATHPLIDEPGDMNPNAVGTINKLVTSSYFGTGDGQHDMDPVLQSEHLATIAAAAIVVPRRLRAEYRAQLAAGTITIGKIAIELRAPDHIVSLALGDGFHKLCEEAMQRPNHEAA